MMSSQKFSCRAGQRYFRTRSTMRTSVSELAEDAMVGESVYFLDRDGRSWGDGWFEVSGKEPGKQEFWL